MRRVRTRRDPEQRAMAAHRHAIQLAEHADDLPRRSPSGTLAKAYREAADAYEVASDAWEEAGKKQFAATLRLAVDPLRRSELDYRGPHVRVTKTYETWDEEALEAGATDDQGFEYDSMPMTLREVVSELEQSGPWELGSVHMSRGVPHARLPASMHFYSTDADVDYGTGEETRYALHIYGSDQRIRRLRDFLRGHHPRIHMSRDRGRSSPMMVRRRGSPRVSRP